MNKSKQKLICKIDKNLQILVDEHQYILRKNNNQNKDWFYTDLETVIQDIFELKLKEFSIHSEEKNLRNLGKSIEKARGYIHKIIRPMMDNYRR